MKCVFADIRSPYTEPMAVPHCAPIQTQKKPIAFRARAKHSKPKKLLTPGNESNETSERSSLYGD
jgi:hypothetical protein